MLAASCEQEISAGNKLTQAERDYLRTLAAQKCLKESKSAFEDFAEKSNDLMVDFPQGKTWKIVYSKGTAEIDTSYIYVWKVNGSKVYFRYLHTEGSSVSNKFFKIDTDTNTDMVMSFQTLYCNKSIENPSVSSSNISADIATNPKRILESTDNYVEASTKYTMASSYPFYIGSLNTTITKKYFKNSSTSTTTKTDTYTYKVTLMSGTTTQPASYTNASISNRKYCGVKFTTPDVYTFPLVLDCPTTSDTGTVDSDGNGVVDFDPQNEL